MEIRQQSEKGVGDNTERMQIENADYQRELRRIMDDHVRCELTSIFDELKLDRAHWRPLGISVQQLTGLIISTIRQREIAHRELRRKYLALLKQQQMSLC